MNLLRVLSAIALLALAFAAAAQKPEAPKGSYLTSCFGCTIIGEGRSLTCSCTKNNGGRNFARADLLLCESRSYSNQDGRLVCDPELMAKGSEALPAGSYRSSCHSCMRKGNELSCSCMNKGAQYVASTVDLAGCKSKQVGNHDGKLACDRR